MGSVTILIIPNLKSILQMLITVDFVIADFTHSQVHIEEHIKVNLSCKGPKNSTCTSGLMITKA